MASAKHADFLARLGISYPVIQAPMAGVSTPEMAAAVSIAGGLGSLGLGAETAQSAARVIAATRALTSRALHLNVFCHLPAVSNPRIEQAWLARLAPEFRR